MKNRHPDKEIDAAVKHALGKGWILTKASGHAWGILRCPITTTSADVANFVRCPYGARQGARATTRAPCEKGWMAASTMGTKTMSEYEFTLTFSLPGEDDNPEQYLDALYESGCDDAVLGTGQPGTIGLDFVREAESAEDAVRSAIANVEAAIPGPNWSKRNPISSALPMLPILRNAVGNMCGKSP